MRGSVTVRVPATSANLGPCYDSVGMALDLHNELTVSRAEEVSIEIEGEGAAELPRDESNLVVQGLKTAFSVSGIDVPPLKYHCVNHIPFAAGLGSSSAAIVSGILAGLVLTGKELAVDEVEELLQIAASIEGHIDNLAPAIYGGMQIGFKAGDTWRTSAVSIPYGLQCVVFLPDAKAETAAMRGLLGDTVTRDEAVFNIGRTALLVNAFATGKLEELKYATEDALHQPARSRVMPALEPAVRAAVAAGAHGAFLSGAGAAILAVTSGRRSEPLAQSGSERREQAVAAAMVSAAAAVGVRGRVVITRPAMEGACVTAVSDVESDVKVAYRSTRDVDAVPHTFEEVVMRGLAPDGGLFVPTSIPSVSMEHLACWRNLSFVDLACAVMRLYIPTAEISTPELRILVQRSYSTFRHEDILPLVEASDDGSMYLLEQFHGPTCAFKDVALQLVGNLFEFFLLRKASSPEAAHADTPNRITVVGATSGDTGSAAIAGLRGKANIECFILHPKGRVAPVQEAQMTSVLDANVHNVAVEGTFDDCQSIVKELFGDAEFRSRHNLAAVNSINWARILAQVVYYFYAYLTWTKKTDSPVGAPLRFCVPSGNFGNALACYYARRMGLPVQEIVVATNANDILHRFFSTGDFTKTRVTPTLAPAMDITIPSNFERFLFHHASDDAKWTAEWMGIAKDSIGWVMGSDAPGILGAKAADAHDPSFLPRALEIFASHTADDDLIRATIAAMKKARGYTLCPHTASGVSAAFTRLSSIPAGIPTEGDEATPPTTPVVVMATAHPAKFVPPHTTAADMVPPVPDCLARITELPTRCMTAPNDADAIRGIVEGAVKA